MLNIQITDYNAMVVFWLAFTRWSAIIIQLPLFDNVSIPSIVKVLSSIMITFVFYDFVAPEILADINYLGIENFWILTLFNVLVGLTIGFFVKSIMFIFMSSGAIITQQIGFSALRYFRKTRLGVDYLR